MNLENAIEMIECAKINVKNMNKVGIALMPLVVLQLDQALHDLDPETYPDPSEQSA